ncbi:MAG: hypothetical protein PUF72_11120 [Clostridiales bacterium]|nr:hypothetical protein [Clostridiales bacterium]
MKTIKKLTAILSCIAVTGSLAATVAAAENDVTTNVTINAYAIACGYQNSWGNDGYKNDGSIHLGGSYTGDIVGAIDTVKWPVAGGDGIKYNEKDAKNNLDTNVSYLKFTLPAEVTAKDTYTLTMKVGDYGHNQRQANMDIFAAIADMNTAVMTSTQTAPGDNWTTITWATRPTISGVQTVATDVDTTKGNTVTLNLTNVLMGRSGTVTVALLSKPNTTTTTDKTMSDYWFTDVNITRTVPAAEPTFTASVVPDTFFTVNGTGEYATETASGFIAEITSDKSGASPTSLTLYVNEVDKGTQNFKNISGITGNIHVGIIVSGIIKDENDISMTVK